MNINKVMLAGRLTRDPETRFTPKGTALTEFGLAISRAYSADGDKREETTYVDVTLWGKQAEIAAKYLKKGTGVFVDGRLNMDQWNDKATGQKRTKLTVVAENFQFVGGKKDEGSPQFNTPGDSQSGDVDDWDSDVPF